MMKRLYSLLLIACFAVASCTEEMPMPENSKDNIVLNVFNSPMTKATADPGTEYERKLNRLDCFFYVKDMTNEPCVYYQKVEVNDVSSATVSFFVDDIMLRKIFPSGSLCDIFIIANFPGDDSDFEIGNINTTVEKLGAHTLSMTSKEYDAVNKPFVMVGSGKVQKGKNSNATATIALERVASKVTMTVKIPKSIQIDKGIEKVNMYPVLVDSDGNEPLKTSFRYGTNKSYLTGAYPDHADNYIWTDKIPYTKSEELSTDEYYTFTCDMPFYTYARSWEKGADNAAYVTFEIPWGEDLNEDGKIDNNYQTYYYQILVNGKGRNFEPNAWYDMSVKVGILGSTIETEPRLLEDMTYYILDWTTEPESDHMGGGDRFENVEIENYTYLVVQNKRLEIDNASSGVIKFDASHNIGLALNKESRPVEDMDGFNSPDDAGAFYINCKGNRPVIQELERITEDDNFQIDNEKGEITFTHQITRADEIYSPVFVYATVWLEIDGKEGLTSDDEQTFSEEITIVQYPSIYITPTRSTSQSVYINNQTGDSSIEIGSYSLGKATGTNSTQGFTHEAYMFTIAVSSFSGSDKFTINNTGYTYIIGDPRNHTPNKDLNNDNYIISNGNNGWRSDSNGKYLENYYPTMSASTNASDPSFDECRIISPKFKVASMFGGYSSACSHEGAAMRCASYQEDGYPAGRWRLPTTAEVLFVIELQAAESIQNLFFGGNYYYSASHSIQCQTGGVTITNPRSTGSVRCVYDEWYWGTTRDAKAGVKDENGVVVGADGEARTKDDYFFTWGDKKIW